MRFFSHLVTITRHRNLVMKYCFKCGIYWRGIRHDWSKYSPSEFIPGVRYYQGNRSPQTREREVEGYSSAWLHHKGRNRHHYEYWTEHRSDGTANHIKMPAVYFAEMVCDRVAATKIYLKDLYTDSSPLNYFYEKTDRNGMNAETAQDLEAFLVCLSEKGEEAMFSELKVFVKEHRKAEKEEKKRLHREYKESENVKK